MHIEVDSHTHTIASGHAYSTLGENVAAAAVRGMKIIAITDHGPAMPGAPHLWHFMNIKVVPRIINGVGVLRGAEANILNSSGELDMDAKALQRLDIVLGGLHEPIFAPQNKKAHTDAVVKAMASGQIDVFAHGGNPSFPIDVDEVAQVAAEHRVLIEINNSSFTTSRAGSEENCRVLAEAVARHGGWLAFGSDAHVATRVGVFDQCVSLVQSVGFPEERILNRGGTEFINFLIAKGKPSDLLEISALFD